VSRPFAIPPGRLLAIGLLALAVLLCLVGPPSKDFTKAYYPVAVSLLDSGRFVYTYEGFKNLPIVALLIAPFGLVAPEVATRLFLASEILAYLFAFMLAARDLASTPHERMALAFLFLASRPFYSSLWLGQLTAHTLLLLVGMMVAHLRGRQLLAGALLSGAFLLKIPIGLLFLYFVAKRQWELVTASMVSFLAMLALSLAIFGWPLHVEYYQSAIAANLGQTLIAYNNQNPFAFVARYLYDPALFDWTMVPVPPLLYSLLSWTLIAGLAGLLAWIWLRRERAPRAVLTEIALMICLAVIFWPVSWDHYYMFLILPLWVALANLQPRWPAWGLGLWVGAWLLQDMPARLITDADLVALPWGITFASAPFLGCLLLMALLVRQYLDRLPSAPRASRAATPASEAWQAS
jgi:Glycosyltransferase family 87